MRLEWSAVDLTRGLVNAKSKRGAKKSPGQEGDQGRPRREESVLEALAPPEVPALS